MARGEVVVNRVSRMERTILAETDIPLGVFHSPMWIPKIDTTPDLDLIVAADGLIRKPRVVCFSAESLSRITQARVRAANQRTIGGGSADPIFEKFRAGTLLMVDPQSEYFTVSKKDKTVTLPTRNRLAKLPKFPNGVTKIISDRTVKPADFWKKTIPELYVTLNDWYHEYQKDLRPAIFLPPVNVVDGNTTLETALELNQTAAEAFPLGEDPVVPAMYLIIGWRALTSPDFMETVFNRISSVASDQRLLVTKFQSLRNIVNDADRAKNLRDFLERVDTLKESNEDTFLHFTLDAREEGLAFLGNGVDAYVEPSSGWIPIPGFTPKTKEEREREAAELDLVQLPDLWLHPRLRVDKRLSGEEIAKLCDCPAHNATGLEKVQARRAHRFNVRSRETDMLAEAVGTWDSSYIRRVLQRGENPNVLRLLSEPIPQKK